jgi:hypothetical protein
VSIPQWFLLGSLLFSVAASAALVRKVISAWTVGDPAARRGRPGAGALYSLTGAMLPWKKESARLYPASYVFGVVYHAGSFLGFAWLVILFFDLHVPAIAIKASVILLSLAALSGLVLLVKRIVSRNLRYFSSPDDYFSNVLVTSWQILMSFALLSGSLKLAVLVLSGVLFVYMPASKLRHAVFFVPARVYLGLFYGRRGVWPEGKRRSWQV